MSKLDELRIALKRRNEVARDLVARNQNFAHQLVEGLRLYLDLPEHYSVGRGSDSEVRRYVSWQYVEQNGSFTVTDTMHEAIASYYDGYFEFGFGLALSEEENSRRKFIFQIPIECRWQDEQVEINLHGEKMQVVTSDGKIVNDADLNLFLFKSIKGSLEDAAKGAGPQIGFDLIKE
ncbi:MAG: hypothetical protein AAF408_00765 [Pseudomonadota bacterium]